MLLGYPSESWKLCLTQRKPGNSERGWLQFSHPAPRSSRHLCMEVTMAWGQHPPLAGAAYASHLFRTETQKAEPGGDKPQYLFLMCSPGFAEILIETLVLIWGKARHCWTAHPAPDFTRWSRCSCFSDAPAPADVPAFRGSGNLVICLLLPLCKSLLSWCLETAH